MHPNLSIASNEGMEVINLKAENFNGAVFLLDLDEFSRCALGGDDFAAEAQCLGDDEAFTFDLEGMPGRGFDLLNSLATLQVEYEGVGGKASQLVRNGFGFGLSGAFVARQHLVANYPTSLSPTNFLFA